MIEQMRQNQNLYFYLGRLTHYLKVVKESILAVKDSLENMIQFEIENGNSYQTPYNHGLLISEHLNIRRNLHYSRLINEIIL